jgi:hypothetical protein
MVITKDRLDMAVIALHDHGTRDGATKASVLDGMKQDGFTREEVAAAAQEMNK